MAEDSIGVELKVHDPSLMRIEKEKTMRRDMAWLHAALIFALDMSKDPGRRVGAVIVAPGNRLCSFGYNGLVAGMPETDENWARPRKYDLVRHAEKNAMFCAPFDLRGCTLYSTLRPCHDCLGDAVNCGVTRVVFMEDNVPFAIQNEEVYIEFTRLITVHTLKRDEVSDKLIQLYGMKYDRYKEKTDAKY